MPEITDFNLDQRNGGWTAEYSDGTVKTGNLTSVAGDGIVGLAPYVGFVANRARSCFAFSSGHKQWRGRHGFYMRETCSDTRFVWGAWHTGTGNTEAALGADMTVTADLEYPAGVYTQITFGGSPSGTASAGANVTSDPVSVTIPRGAKAWLHYYMTSTAGMIYCGGANIPYSDHDNGDYFAFAASGLANTTIAGDGSHTQTTTDAANGFSSPPLAIVGTTTRAGFALIGDSRVTGIGDRYGDARRQRGILERSIGEFFGCAVYSQSSETALNFGGASGSRRTALANLYASHVICEHGVNDLGSGQVPSRVAAIWAKFAGKRVYAVTLSPVASSSDSFATLAGQTPGGGEAERVVANKFIRGMPSPLSGVIDVSDVVESSRNSGKWNIYLTADPDTAFDGTHETSAMCRAIRASGILSPDVFR
jgi:hypothetical protein